MPLDTSVSDRFQEQFEQAVRDVLAGISQADAGTCRELPPPRSDDALALDCAPGLDAVVVRSGPHDRTLGVRLYFGEAPAGLPADGVEDPAANPSRAAGRSPPTLAELGGGHDTLAGAVVDTLAAYCGAPGHAPERVFLGGDAALLSTESVGPETTFATWVRYPEYVERVYAEGRGEMAERYGLPF